MRCRSISRQPINSTFRSANHCAKWQMVRVASGWLGLTMTPIRLIRGVDICSLHRPRFDAPLLSHRNETDDMRVHEPVSTRIRRTSRETSRKGGAANPTASLDPALNS